MGTWGRKHGVGLAQGRRSFSALQKKPRRSLLPPPKFHSFRSSLPTCHLHCDKMLHKWFQWGFFIRRSAENEPFGAKNRAEFGSVGRGRDERFCFGGCWKAKREEEEKKFSFYCRGIFLTEISAIGAIAEDFWCFNSPSSYPEQVAKLGVRIPMFLWLDCNVWCPHCDDDVCVTGLSAENVWLRGKVLRSVVSSFGHSAAAAADALGQDLDIGYVAWFSFVEFHSS